MNQPVLPGLSACLCIAAITLAGCAAPPKPVEKSQLVEKPQPVYFKVDPATAAAVTGRIRFSGRKPVPKPIDLSQDPACLEAHKGRALDESVVVGAGGALANVFVYIKSGLGEKTFEPPLEPATLDQNGCWFRPRVLGVQTAQTLAVTNSDPVTHNVHPLPQINREWNHSQGPGEPPLARKFPRPEIMIRVKCNIHSWMRAYIGVVEHPYFAVTTADGNFEIRNLPPGDYTLGVWHETLGTQEQKIAVPPSGRIRADFTFKGE